MKVTREEYVLLIRENIDWLDRQPEALEKDHIRRVMVWSIDQLYPPVGEQAEHDWDDSPEVLGKRCKICLASRDFAGPYWEYSDAYGKYTGGVPPPCAKIVGPVKTRWEGL